MSGDTQQQIHLVAEQMNRMVIGQETVVHSLILALLSNGNVLLEGLPGTAKTRSIKTLARILAIDPDAFVVIVSSLGTEDAVHECLTTGARSFLQKPFTKDDFIEFMRDLTRAA